MVRRRHQHTRGRVLACAVCVRNLSMYANLFGVVIVFASTLIVVLYDISNIKYRLSSFPFHIKTEIH